MNTTELDQLALGINDMSLALSGVRQCEQQQIDPMKDTVEIVTWALALLIFLYLL